MVWSEPTKSRTTSAPVWYRPGHRLLDRGRVRWAPSSAARARASGRGSTATTCADVVARRICTARWPRPPTPMTSAVQLAGQRVALGSDRVVRREPGVGQRREHGRPARRPRTTKCRSSGSRTYVGQSAVAAQAAADPAVEGDAVVVLAAPAVVALSAGPDAVHAHRRDRPASGRHPRPPPRPGRRPRARGSAAGRRAGCPPSHVITKRSEWQRPTARTSTSTSRPRGVGTGTSTSSTGPPQPGSRYADISRGAATARTGPAGRGRRRARGSRRCPRGARPT